MVEGVFPDRRSHDRASWWARWSRGARSPGLGTRHACARSPVGGRAGARRPPRDEQDEQTVAACVGACGVSVAESALDPPGPIPNPVVTRGSAGEYCGGDPVGGEAVAGTPRARTHGRQSARRHADQHSSSTGRARSSTARGGAVAARWAHNPKVGGSNPSPATQTRPDDRPPAPQLPGGVCAGAPSPAPAPAPGPGPGPAAAPPPCRAPPPAASSASPAGRTPRTPPHSRTPPQTAPPHHAACAIVLIAKFGI